MTIEISDLAYAARKASQRDGFPPLKHGHALELAAAAFGYASLAAYQAAIAAGDEVADLTGSAHVVVQLQRVVTRAAELRPRAPSLTHVEWINRAFAQCLPDAQLHLDEHSVLKSLSVLVDRTTVNDGYVSGEMAVSNCDGVREIYMPFDFGTGELAPVGDSHVIYIDGHITMDVHEERPPFGQKISVQATIELERLGRYVIAKPVFRIERAKLICDFANDDDDALDIPLRP